jgi:hypothetical protein
MAPRFPRFVAADGLVFVDMNLERLSTSLVLRDAVRDPMMEQTLVTYDPVSLSCAPSQSIILPIVSFGSIYRIQRLTLHLATFLLSRAIIARHSKIRDG